MNLQVALGHPCNYDAEADVVCACCSCRSSGLSITPVDLTLDAASDGSDAGLQDAYGNNKAEGNTVAFMPGAKQPASPPAAAGGKGAAGAKAAARAPSPQGRSKDVAEGGDELNAISLAQDIEQVCCCAVLAPSNRHSINISWLLHAWQC